MLRNFWKNRNGNYAMITAIAMIPLMGAVALAVDYTEIVRERQDTLNALDAAGIATARYIAEGATDAQAVAYANTFFSANLTAVQPANVTLNVLLPSANTSGGGTLKLTADLTYNPYFLPAAAYLIGKKSSAIKFSASSEIRLRNTIEVALVLDNSGSMKELGKGSNKVRFDLLKDAAKQLVDQLAGQASQMQQIEKPVQFSLVPFAASVNVGPDNADAGWMDKTGISPIHHENFDWTTLNKNAYPDKYAEKVGSAWYARGKDWDATQKDQPLTRFSLYRLMQHVSAKRGNNYTYAKLADWGGCVEARPYPYNVDDTTPTTGTPETLFVPMFGPDETDNTDSRGRVANNDWHADGMSGKGNDSARQAYMPKYFDPGTSVTSAPPKDSGPNASCTTTPITPLTDVSKAAGLKTIKDAIDAMQSKGATNVPEGMAWGWRTLSSGEPFTGGRPENNRGNDKVVIVLTDGANTYYTPESVSVEPFSGSGAGNDLAGTKAIYSALGYILPFNKAYAYGRMFLLPSDAPITKTTYTNENYGKAMNEQFKALCTNAKANNLIVMTIGLDLDSKNSAEKTQIDLLKNCASDSKVRKDPNDPNKPAKLFWNSTGASLSDDFREIGNELSNLRIVG